MAFELHTLSLELCVILRMISVKTLAQSNTITWHYDIQKLQSINHAPALLKLDE